MANWSFEEVGDAASVGGRGRFLVQHKIPVDGRLLVQASHRVELALDEVLLPGDGQEHEALGEEP